jgi:hypothetical protein
MRDGGQSEAPEPGPGQIWLIEQPAVGSASDLDRCALAGADVVLYDHRLGPFIAGLLPRGRYAEPLSAAVEEDAPAISERALKLAAEGWSVVQLIEPSRSWRRRLCAAVDAPDFPGRVIAKSARPSGSREARLEELRELVDGSSEGELLLTLIVAPPHAPAPAVACAFTANGLAG